MTEEIPAHGVSNAHQISYPGGKNGFWQVECVCGGYRALESRQRAAEKRVEQHAQDKARVT